MKEHENLSNSKHVAELTERSRAELEEVLSLLCEDYVSGRIKSFDSFCFSAISIARDFRGGSIYGYVLESDRAELLMRVLFRALEEKPRKGEVRVPLGIQKGLMIHLDIGAGRNGMVRRQGGGARYVFSHAALDDPMLDDLGSSKEPSHDTPTSAFSYGARLLRSLGFARATPDLVQQFRKDYTKNKD